MLLNQLSISKLQLQNFRNLEKIELEAGLIPNIIIGKNGAGKTSILESLSLFVPGKGLRNASFEDILQYEKTSWRSSLSVNNNYGKIELSSEYFDSKRNIYLNETKINNNELNKLMSISWLSPQMSYLFNETGERRKFFDRIVYNFDPEHASRMSKYEYYIKERIKLLTKESFDIKWLEIIETKIVDLSIEVTEARNNIINYLNQAAATTNTSFPKANVRISCNVNELGGNKELIASHLVKNRTTDGLTHRTNFGIHKTDFVVSDINKNIIAKFCSTGEQKSLLISIILASIIAKINHKNQSTILLLDEIMSHLDEFRRQELIEFLQSLNSQIWITATDEHIFNNMQKNVIIL